MNYNGQDQWSAGWVPTSSGWSNTPDEHHTGQQVDGVEDLIDGFGATSIGHQQVYDQNSAYHIQTYQIPAYRYPQQQPYPNTVYQPQPFPHQQYQATLFPSPGYLTSTYSNPALQEQFLSQAGFSQTYSTGNYTHRSQPGYSGGESKPSLPTLNLFLPNASVDQLQSHAGPASQDHTPTFSDKGKPSEPGTRYKNRGPGDGNRDRGNGKGKTNNRGYSSNLGKISAEPDDDEPFFETEDDLQTQTNGGSQTSSRWNGDGGQHPESTGQVTSPSAESAESSNGLKFGNGSNAGVFFPDPSSATAYEDSNSQQTMLPMNLALRAGYLLPLGLPSGAIDYSVSTNRSISGPLDQRYKVHPSSKFNPGSVFKILWPEPAGVNLNELSCEIERDLAQDPTHLFYSSIRRYIVVGNDEGNCTCVKTGVKPRQHGIAYHVGNQPQSLEGEPQLGFEPIQIEMLDSPHETLAMESRVNYSKLMTIEHNYKVFFIGRVTPEDFKDIVIPAVDACWNAKNRGMTSDHNRHISRSSVER
ncbi:hypothetical protein NEUTE1DRAFT_58405 [Neurospora tetrasperma FGSC 2508]|uniref:DUF6590 domain-containing protein n=1 Tax=Neurospora tetrasperma (strain FGSC 2508 / ATCC MYA-4615 / P0657) TaxID=510951 RepID=F8MC76_NEUT8|nr:uncharacterized protein NEUTE1DRAFT_58405 [Neurospora tetrasperma FGSC 2508]EGO61231.1 hypothetical protein NEUTE1DRAFT_58405 [Neurospora tetrasperma FGSC 2508]EGZ74764.1 hypothetical protein NEUTE2DRAFT_82400 [Neurospora tetrasperma FGSC 2509]